jgi:hypothetical protein
MSPWIYFTSLDLKNVPEFESLTHFWKATIVCNILTFGVYFGWLMVTPL